MIKCSVNNFANILKEATFENQEDESTNDFRHGVNETIEMMKTWFEDNKITYFNIPSIEELDN